MSSTFSHRCADAQRGAVAPRCARATRTLPGVPAPSHARKVLRHCHSTDVLRQRVIIACVAGRLRGMSLRPGALAVGSRGRLRAARQRSAVRRPRAPRGWSASRVRSSRGQASARCSTATSARSSGSRVCRRQRAISRRWRSPGTRPKRVAVVPEPREELAGVAEARFELVQRVDGPGECPSQTAGGLSCAGPARNPGRGTTIASRALDRAHSASRSPAGSEPALNSSSS